MDVDDTVASPSRKVAKTDTSTESTSDSTKSDRKSDGEDPKPRIVLTFRSEKRGAKTSNMKIVSTEEKHGEQASVRRSGRSNRCTKPMLEIDSYANSSRSRKRSARRSSTELDVVANAIARKEKSYNETLAPSRPVRVIKPTAKVLANEELMKECKKEDEDEGVSTRRSARKTTRSSTKDLKKEESEEEGDNSNEVMKLQHLCKLGLKAIDPEDGQTSKDVSLTVQALEDLPIQMPQETHKPKRRRKYVPCERSPAASGRSSPSSVMMEEESAIRLPSSNVPSPSFFIECGASTPSHSSTSATSSIPPFAIPVASVSPSSIPSSSILSPSSIATEAAKPTPPRGLRDQEISRILNMGSEFLGSEDEEDDEDDELRELVPRALRDFMTDIEVEVEREEVELPMNDSNEGEPIEIDDDEDEEIDDDTEVISKLLEDDANSGDSEISEGHSVAMNRPRRKVRDEPVKKVFEPGMRKEYCGKLPYQPIPDPQFQEYLNTVPESYYANGLPVYSRPKPARPDDDDDISLASAAETGAEAVRPGDADENTVIGKCFCEAPSNIYADPSELTEPVFCQAIDIIDEARVGCCHPARRIAGTLAPLLSAGPRAPYTLLCKRHTAQMRKHMCCSTCGVFCTQGTFYRCPLGHVCHIECSLIEAGCPHCGIYCYRWAPVRHAKRVRIKMDGANTVFLTKQKEHCKPAFLSFAALPPTDDTPPLPESLLPSPPVDLKQLCARAIQPGDVTTTEALCDAILAGESAETLVPKIMSCPDLTGCVHCAAGAGAVCALYLLQYARADLDALDKVGRTPLMVALEALLDTKPENNKKSKTSDADSKTKEESEIEDINMEEPVDASETNKPTEEDLQNVVKYLIASGCDLDIAGPDGMTALHMCASAGAVWPSARLLAAGARPDAADAGGWTPLVWAAEHDHQDVLRLLVSHGAEPMTVDTEGNSAVHWCALAGASRALAALLDAEPNAHSAPNAHNDTPLHIAARQGHYACVVILLARGARTDLENTAGELPVEVCSGPTQTLVSLNMQMALALRNNTITRHKLLCSDISRGREPYPIPVVNEVDDETTPQFSYVTAHVFPQAILVDNSMGTMQGCTCSSSCSGSSCACGVLSVRRWWCCGRLARGFPHHDPPMLFECNATCGCDARKCGNNVLTQLLQTGSVWIRVEVFRTINRGWGLRSTRRVRRGAPIAAYCGEVILPEMVDSRADDSYMFALDVKQDLLEQCASPHQLCVDAASFGGAARFVNHSCRPRAAPVRVHTHTRDLRLPVVVLFALTDIGKGEEITFDYGDKFWSVKNKTMACACGEPECRYPTIKTEEADP